MGYQMFIAATREDWMSLFHRADTDQALRFYRPVAYSVDAIVAYELQNIPDLGMAKTGIAVQESGYLAVPVTVPLVPREIRQNNGVVKYAIDQLTNSDSFTFWPGGIWQEQFFMIGEISSVYKEGMAAGIAKKIRSYITRKYYSHNLCRIGPECHSLYAARTFTFDYRPSNQY